MKRITEPFGKAGLIVAVVALVAALVGGAYAASGGLTGKQKKEVKKIALSVQGQGPAGPQGPAGANGKDGSNGSNGSNGAAGEKGATGPQGVPGTPGTPGTAGEDGKSPEIVGVIPPGEPECEEAGGIVYEVPGSGEEVEVCNGAEGEKGEEGSPWTLGGTLPPGATETGTWAFNGTSADGEGIVAPISFPIPLAFSLEEGSTHYGEPNEGGAFEPGEACPSTTINFPKAAPGQLCVYIGREEGTTFEGIFKYSSGGIAGETNRGGAVLSFHPTAAVAIGGGTFAVTGCAPAPNGEECESE